MPSNPTFPPSVSKPSSVSLLSVDMETSGTLGTLWVGLGLGGFYIALIWVNTLLGMVLTPLFLLPATFLMDKKKKAGSAAPGKH